MTGTGNREHNLRRVPGTDTSNFAETLVSFARKLLSAPTVGDTLEPMTLGDCDDIDDLILLKDGGNFDGLLKQALGEFDLVCDRATVDLNFQEVGFLLSKTSLADLRVCKDTNNSAIFADALELARERLAAVFRMLLRIPRERFLL